jgi:hypothetical protein
LSESIPGGRDSKQPGFAQGQRAPDAESSTADANLDRWLTATRAWIAEGGTYRVRPNISTAACLCTAAFFFPALLILLALAFGDGFLLVAGVVIALLPIGGIGLLIAYRRNTCLYLSREDVGRTGLRGSTVARCPRGNLGGIRVKRGSYGSWFGTASEPEGTWDDNVMYVVDRQGRPAFKVTLNVWTPDQVQLLARLVEQPQTQSDRIQSFGRWT